MMSMHTWFERGEDDAKSAGDALTTCGDRMTFARQSYAWWMNLFRRRPSVETYREYLQGFTSVLPFKLD